MAAKLDNLTSKMANTDIRINENEWLLMALFGNYSNLKKEDIANLHNTTSDHEEALSDCGSHKDIPNGDVSGDSFVGGAPVISCNSGYSQTGSAQCKSPAAWETDVKCLKDCAVLHIAHGMVSPATSVPHGTTVTVTCDRGYVVVANNTTVCNKGDFTAVPSCRRGYFTEMTAGSSGSFNIRLGDDDHISWITGAGFLSDGRLSLCDYTTKRLKLLSSDFTVIDSLKLPSSPWDVSAVNSTTVIVTIPQSKLLQYVHVLPHFSLSSRIQLDKKCWGVDVAGDEVFTSCYYDHITDDGEVMVFDLGGTLKRRLGVNQDNSYMFKAPRYLTVSSNTSYVYVSDIITDKVTCLSTAGDVIYQYDDPELDKPESIIVDDADNTIVLGQWSHNAHVITASGKKHSIFLTSSDGIQAPYSVAYRQSDATLVIGSLNNNNLLVFKLKK